MRAADAEKRMHSLPPYTFLQPCHEQDLQELARQIRRAPWRPAWHLCPPSGLFNDPNGLHYDGTFYHVFCQWYPFGARHDMKHWYHFKSRDLKNWQVDSNILIPDQNYEKNGCYSGNAWRNPATGQVHLYYTANYKDENLRKIPLQAMAVIEKDGTISKSPSNPILSTKPEGAGDNIRDPYVFDFQGQTWMLIGAESSETPAKGMLLLYKMMDPETFACEGEVDIWLDGRKLDLGRMVECPGLIQVDGQDLLFLCILGDASAKWSPNRFAAVVLQGTFDPQKRSFMATMAQNVDEGFDYYAPQPFYGENQVPMVYGWFGNGDQPMPEDEYGWRHGLSLPRTLKIQEGRLYTPPHPAAASCFETIELNIPEAGANDRPVLIQNPKNPCHLHLLLDEERAGCILQIGQPGDCFRIAVSFQNHTLCVDRSDLALPIDPDYGMKRCFSFEPAKDHTLDLYLDHSFNELYFDGGRHVLSFRACLKAEDGQGQLLTA